jgi:hypothetical protein
MRVLKVLKSMFRRPFRSYLLEGKYRIIPAFECGGKQYWMFDQAMEVPTGRTLGALAIYAEMDMRVTRDYLELHTKAMEKILSDTKKLDITSIAVLNKNLKERLDLMVLPEFIYKLASVMFFDKEESPYRYDFTYAEKKIKAWKEDGANLDFFLKTPIGTMIPYLKPLENASPISLNVAEMVAKTHRDTLTDILSAKG